MWCLGEERLKSAMRNAAETARLADGSILIQPNLFNIGWEADHGYKLGPMTIKISSGRTISVGSGV